MRHRCRLRSHGSCLSARKPTPLGLSQAYSGTWAAVALLAHVPLASSSLTVAEQSWTSMAERQRSLSPWSVRATFKSRHSCMSQIRRALRIPFFAVVVAEIPSTLLSHARGVSTVADGVQPSEMQCVALGDAGKKMRRSCVDCVGEAAEVECEPERQVENAEAVLREMFGPLAKLVLNRIPQRRRSSPSATATDAEKRTGTEDGQLAVADNDDADVESVVMNRSGGEAAASASTSSSQRPAQECYYRVSATFRQFGFPVELAVANGIDARETLETCLRQALSSDIKFMGQGSGNRRTAHQQHRGRGQGRYQQNERPNRSTPGFYTQGVSGGGSSSRLSPHQQELKAIMNDLRQLCTHFSRSLKFSVKPPLQSHTTTRRSAGTEGVAETEAAVTPWRCRCYVKEEWSTSPQARLAHEALGSSPNDALVRCVAELRRQYKDEIDSVGVIQEGVHEVAALVQSQRKTVTATYREEAVSGKPTAATAESSAVGEVQDGTTKTKQSEDANPIASLMEPPTYTSMLELTDVRGNTAVYSARRQASPYVGYQTVAMSAIRSEYAWDSDAHLLSDRLAAAPLLSRLRWQFDMLVDHICRVTGKSALEVAWIRLSGTGSSGTDPASGKQEIGINTMGDSRATRTGPQLDTIANLPILFTGSLFTENDALVWHKAEPGRYRVELDTYVQAVYYLLDQYSDCLSSLPCMAAGQGEGLLFPSAELLKLQVLRHDTFPILNHHHGKWSCYALLGTLTMQLLGCPFGTHYHFDVVTKEWVSTVAVNNGRHSSYPLSQRRSKIKGEAWRLACLAALRDNFPHQYAAVLEKHPDVDLSTDTGARAQRYRALPREKRIAHMCDFVSMVTTFAEEDLGWRQSRVRLRNLSGDIGLPQWIAEMEAQVEGEEERRVVAVSPPFLQVKQARKSLFFRLAKQYFPKELEVYQSLNRSDGDDPERESNVRRSRLYDPTNNFDGSMLRHVTSLMERDHATIAPVRITLEARVAQQGSRKIDDAGGRLAADHGDDDDDMELDASYWDGDTSILLTQQPKMLLRPLQLSYSAQVLGERGNVIIADYDSSRATTPADAEAVPVLVTALKSASCHLAGADAETLWTEYETYPVVGANSTRELCLALFGAFLGQDTNASMEVTSTGLTDSGREPFETGGDSLPKVADGLDVMNDPTAPVNVIVTSVGNYWFGTAVLPRFGMLPIARAVATSKRRCSRDALTLATRRSFPRVLQYMIKRDMASATVATEILTEPIVEQLPPEVCREVLAQLAKAKRNRPPPPFRLLMRCMKVAHPTRDHRIRVQNSYDSTHGFQYRLYLQRGSVVRQGNNQLVGYGASTLSQAEALDRAALMALENLFETALHAAEKMQQGYGTVGASDPQRV